MAKLIPEPTAKEIRERYEWLHGLNDGEAQDNQLTPRQIDHKLASEFSVSVSSVRDIVTGITHGEAGGPIDHARRIRRDLLAQETLTLGGPEARRRFNLRCRNIDPAPKVERLVQRITILDSRGKDTPHSVDLQPGYSVRVELVPVGGDR